MVLNVKKSGLMRIGHRFNADLSPVLVCGVMLPVVEKISYLVSISTLVEALGYFVCIQDA